MRKEVLCALFLLGGGWAQAQPWPGYPGRPPSYPGYNQPAYWPGYAPRAPVYLGVPQMVPPGNAQWAAVPGNPMMQRPGWPNGYYPAPAGFPWANAASAPAPSPSKSNISWVPPSSRAANRCIRICLASCSPP